jgi:hypothetical protein
MPPQTIPGAILCGLVKLSESTLRSGHNGRSCRRDVAKRRGEKSKNGGKLVTNATVNRTVTEPLRRLLSRAADWGVRFEHRIEWKRFTLPEPQERVRELASSEADRIDLAMRDDYEPFSFARATGLRLRECFLTWSEVDWESRLNKDRQGRAAYRHPANFHCTSRGGAIPSPMAG